MRSVVDRCSTKGYAIGIGTVVDNEDCVYRTEEMLPSREEAKSTVAAVCERATATTLVSEPLQVDYTIVIADDEVKLDLAIIFPCQAEEITFRLSLRDLF